MKKIITAIIPLFLLWTFLAGCSSTATKGKMMERIEQRTQVGMSEEEFKEKVPNAQLMGEEGGKKVYVLALREPCFFCGSGKAFVRSYESYATKFTLQDGKLTSSERILDGK